jgi:hypothetical protein
MARSEHQPSKADPAAQATPYADRVYRSGGGIAGGVLVLALVLWLGGDALFTGDGRVPWLSLAALLLVVPLLIGFTVRPAVFAGVDRLRIRNPLRTISVPWGAVKNIRARFSTELFTKDGSKYQMWAVPVSLRQRKRADRRMGRMERAAPASSPARMSVAGMATSDVDPTRAMADQAIVEMNELAERAEDRLEAQGAPVVRWAYEVIGPSIAGAILLIVLLVIG